MDLLLPHIGGLAQALLAFIVALSVIVFVHEFGHYIVGRWCGIRAEVFSIGFGRPLISWRDRHGTRWQIAALPFGGYVKFLGDADAASATADTAALASMPEELREATLAGAALWKRALTVAAGPLANFLLAIVIFSGVVMVRGVALDTPVVGELKALPQDTGGIAIGDRILSVEERETPDLAALLDVAETVTPAPFLPYEVMRGEERLAVQAPPPMPPLIESVQPRSAAADAGLRRGDVIVAVEGRPVWTFREVREQVLAAEGRPLALTVWRGGERFTLTLAARRVDLPRPDGSFETRWLIGVTGGFFFEPATRTPGPLEALSIGALQSWFIIRTSVSGLWHMAVGAISACNLSGPVGIAETSAQAAREGLESFVWFIGVLSVAVGFLNILPVPVLDGGHLVLYAWEAVTGRQPGEAAMRILMSIGLALLMTLMLFALYNDLVGCP